MKKAHEHIKVNFPKNENEFKAGNGEGMWVLVDKDTKAAYEQDKTGGRYFGTLDNEPIENIGYHLGDKVVFEMRGEDRPVALTKERADKENLEIWRATPRTVTLTNGQCSTLQVYILMTTQHRKETREAWEKMATYTEDDGTPSIPNAAGNAEFYAKLEGELEAIRNALDF